MISPVRQVLNTYRYTVRTKLCYIIRYYTMYQLHVLAITWPSSSCTKLTEYYIISVSNGGRDLVYNGQVDELNL